MAASLGKMPTTSVRRLISPIGQGGQLRDLGPELIGDAAPLLLCSLGVVLDEGGGDEGGDHAAAATAGMSQDVTHEVDAGVVEEVGRDEVYALFRRSCYMANIFEPECVLSVSAEGLSGMLAKINT